MAASATLLAWGLLDYRDAYTQSSQLTYGLDNLRFLTPVNPGDTLQVKLTCKEINPRIGAEHGEVRWDCNVTNQNGATVAQYDVLTMVAKTRD